MNNPASTDQRGQFQLAFLHPKYWLNWLAWAWLIVMACLPWAIQWRLATVLGHLAWKLLKSRRKTTLRNLTVCFPEWSVAFVEAQAKQVFIDMMLGVFETLNAWYFPKWFQGRVDIQGLEHLQQAQQHEHGVLLLGVHSTLLDAGGYICRQYFTPNVIYRPQNNPFWDMLIYRNRHQLYPQQIAHDDMRGLIRSLKQGDIIWYSPDQDFGLKQGVMADFFGVPAATLTAHRRLLKMTNAVAIPLFYHRIGNINDPRYQIIIDPILENFPTEDEIADATRTNQIIEQQLRIAPTQYMWFHRRFKTRPEHYPSIY